MHLFSYEQSLNGWNKNYVLAYQIPRTRELTPKKLEENQNLFLEKSLSISFKEIRTLVLDLAPHCVNVELILKLRTMLFAATTASATIHCEINIYSLS